MMMHVMLAAMAMLSRCIFYLSTIPRAPGLIENINAEMIADVCADVCAHQHIMGGS